MIIKFDVNSKRKKNILTNYRPGFKLFNHKSMYSGIIKLLDTLELSSGESCGAIVSFFSDEPFIDSNISDEIEFYEGPNLIGHAIIKEFLGWDKPDVLEM
jgi:hypothetical protein